VTPVAVGITQRSLPPTEFGERRYGLDSRWFPFLAACGLVAVPLPNLAAVAVHTAEALGLGGLILTGGDDLVRYGGPTPDRDETELALLGWAGAAGRPVLGVCRGAQLLLDAHGSTLEPVEGHVAARHVLSSGRSVNSYHRYAAFSAPSPLRVTATCDGVVEAFDHEHAAITGIMWHPEREEPAAPEDVRLVRELFGSTPCAR
jgi:putative glutamine amidotransferase